VEDYLWHITTGWKNTVETLLGGGRLLLEHDDLVEGSFGRIMSGWKKIAKKV
jgi:hypothetical protein